MWRRIGSTMAAIAATGLIMVPSPAVAGGGEHCPDPMPATMPGQVLIVQNCFAPKSLQIATGDTVRWDLEGVGLHTVTFAGLNSGDVAGSFFAKFNLPGSYDYQCIYHPGMAGNVTVTGPATGEEAIVALSDIRNVSGTISQPVQIAGATSDAAAGSDAPPGPTQAQAVELRIDAAGGLIIAAALLMVAVVSATSSIIAVRIARR